MELEHTATENRVEARVLRRVEGIMFRYWVLGLIIALVALIYLARRVHAVTKSLEHPVDIALWGTEQDQRVDWRPETMGDREDTAPAVLSPPEWRPRSPPPAGHTVRPRSRKVPVEPPHAHAPLRGPEKPSGPNGRGDSELGSQE
jgi:hypothetical protein